MTSCRHTQNACNACRQAGDTFQSALGPIEVPGFRVGISAPINPAGQVSFEVETAALASCIRELSTLDHESRHRVLINLVDRYEERRKL